MNPSTCNDKPSYQCHNIVFGYNINILNAIYVSRNLVNKDDNKTKNTKLYLTKTFMQHH